jgi:hypothetical protein
MARFATGPHVFHKTSEGKGFYQRPREENPEIYAVDWEIVMTMVYFGTFAFQLMLVVGVIAGDVAPTVVRKSNAVVNSLLVAPPWLCSF